ncbi:MAG TPA: hypothetical protein ENN53_02550 [Candidatus Acetothermia bacterium]|nr:hypothetical protein [Candidatus Acetothermia bacterium]
MSFDFVALAVAGETVGATRFRDGKIAERISVPVAEGREDVLSRFGGLPLVVHDLASLRAVPGLGTARWVDTQPLAWAVWPKEPDATLPALARRLGIPLTDDAVGRAEATGLLFLRLLAAAGELPPDARALLADLLPDLGWIGPPPAPRGRRRIVAVPPTVDAAFELLTSAGLLARREGQLAYAHAVAEAHRGGEIHLLEAGPGTGKTIGYLVPLLLSLAAGKGRAVVATRTRALQEQLWRRDLPLLRERLGVDLPCALLKGRDNYLCLRRLEEVRHQLVGRELLIPLLVWAARTATGDLDELAGLRAVPAGQEVLRSLPDLPYRCGGWTCPFWERCPSRRARDRARTARLVVVNHALLGADLASGGAILGPYGFLVVDEAHALPTALRDALSVSLSPPVIPRLLGELRRGATGLLAAWGKSADVERVAELWERAAVAHRQFWAAAGAALPREIARYGREDVAPLLPTGMLLAEALDDLADATSDLARDLPDEDAAQARGLGSEIRRGASLVGHLLRPEGEGTVFWYARDGHVLTLTASPVDIGDHLAAALWPNLKGGVLTSATLSMGDDGRALARELGLDPPPPFRAWPSPFPYERVGAFVLRYLPHPDDPRFPAAVAATLRQVLDVVPRRALALFTSRRLLDATVAHLAGTPHLVQRRDGEREQLLARFRNHPPPVALLGLDTLWEGIDLPGEELEILLVVRLPFPVPTAPLVEAQSERIAARGGSPFEELFLPRAVLRLRQGVGRLVRTPADRGALLLADPRLATQPYGNVFLHALPVPAQPIDDPDRLAVALATLFR